MATIMRRGDRGAETAGAVVVDPADLPNQPLLACARDGPGIRRRTDADCSVVFKYGMKRDFNAWLASLGPARR